MAISTERSNRVQPNLGKLTTDEYSQYYERRLVLNRAQRLGGIGEQDFETSGRGYLVWGIAPPGPGKPPFSAVEV